MLLAREGVTNRSDKRQALFVFSFSLIALAAFFFAVPAHAASFVQAQTGTAVTPTTSVTSAAFSPATTAGNLLIAVVAANSSTTINAISGWTQVINTTGTVSQAIFYKTAAAGEGAVTATVTANTGAIAIQVYEYSGASQLVSHLSNTAAGTGTSASTGGITTTKANELVLAAVVSQINTSPTSWTASFTQRTSFIVGGAAARRSGYGGADLLSGAAGLKNPSVTVGSAAWRGTIVSFYDATAPTLAQVTPVPSPTSDTTPDYTFSSDEAGTISYGGDCSSSTTAAINGNTTVTFNALSQGSHSNCTITVTDAAGNASSALHVNTFTVDSTAPTVTGVTSSHSDGSFTVGEAIAVQVNFSESVVVTGTPQLTLTTGSPATTAVNYSGGSGSATLTFTYTVASGNVSADLDYASAGALALAGGTIKDAAGNAATLTLASPGTAGSLGANKNIEINTSIPTITSVTSTTASGSYKAGTVIPITVNFSEPVTSTGSVSVTLETGGTDRSCSFSVSNATSGTCNYTVQAGDTSSDLTTNAILGTIKDNAGNTLIDFTPASNLADSKDIVIDTAIPTITSVTSAHGDGSFTIGEVIPVTVHFSQAVTSTGSVSVTLETGGTDRSCSFSVSNATSGTCNYTVQAGDISSDLTTNAIAGTIKDAAGNAVADFTPATNLAATSAIVIDTAAPTVSSTNPLDTATSVAVGVAPSAAFSQAMDAATITTSTFTLKQGLTPVSGAVSYLGGTATFTPDANLSPSTAYTAAITTGAKDVAGNALAAPYSWSFTTAVGSDITPPTVVSTDPDDLASGVPVGQVVSVVFDEAMKASTITTGSFTLTSSGGSVSGSVVPSGSTATFTPSAPLASSTAYTAHLSTAIQDAAGNPLAAPYSWSFTTADTIAPTVTGVSSSLGNGAYTVGQAVPVQVTFSENVVVTGTPTLTLTTGSPATTAVDYSGGSGSSTLTFTYTVAADNVSADLDYASTGALALAGGTIKDAAGNAAVLTLATPGAAGSLGANKDIEINTHVPTIASVTTATASGSYRAGTVIPITVNFSEPVTSTGSVSVTLETGGTDRSCSFSVSNASSGTCNYTVQSGDTSSDLTTNAILGTIKDDAGNTMVNFTPASNLADSKDIVIDTDIPSVVSTIPADSAINVASNANINATFNEPMDAATLVSPATTFTLKQGLTPISGVVSYGSGTATFNPDADLDPSTVYTAAVSTGAKDAGGNPMAAPYSWSFTTGAGPDLTPPTVVSTDPADSAVSVPVGQVVSVNFDEAMDPTTITASSFTLKQGLTPVSGSVGVSGSQATFTPSASLAPSTVYTATVTTAAKDLAGNALAAQHAWDFTTAAAAGGSSAAGGGAADLLLSMRATPEVLPAGGGSVTFTYTLTARGLSHAKDIAIHDDLGTGSCAPVAYVSGDIDGDDEIDPSSSETWTFTCTTRVTESVTHSAEATGTWNFGLGRSNTASTLVPVGEITAAPSLDLHVTAYPEIIHPGGGVVTFRYRVINTGNAPIDHIKLSGGFCDTFQYQEGDVDKNGELDPTETWTYFCQGNVAATESRKTRVNAQSAGIELTGTANVTVAVGEHVSAPDIDLHITANPPQLPLGGGTAVITYHVYNIGNVPLTDVVLEAGSQTCVAPTYDHGDDNGDGILDLNEKWWYFCVEKLDETEVDAPSVRAHAGALTVTDDSLFIVPVATKAPPADDSTKTGAYDRETAVRNTPDIDTDLGLAQSAAEPLCVLGTPFKLPDDGNPKTDVDSTVYYCGRDGRRHSFLNSKIYATWYQSLNYVRIIDAKTMAQIPLDGSVKYHPGARLIKTPSDPKVYAVSRGGTLRWVTTEALAAELYGADWNKKVDDVPESFMTMYVLGEAIGTSTP